MSALTDSLKAVLADSFAFYLKAHNFHWNVTGPDFYEYHQLFETIYSEVYGSVDMIAELIRACDEIAPGSLSRFKQLTKIVESDGVPTEARAMAAQLMQDNNQVLASLYIAYKAAEAAGEVGISNAMQDRILAHQKHQWFLKSSVKA